jgi:hypothetical protein
MLLAGASLAAGDEMKNAIGNTVKRLDTGETMYWKEDSTYVRKYNGTTETGQWKVENGQVCTQKGTPEAGKAQADWACYTPVGDHKVGETWDVEGTDGTKFQVTMIAGEA